MQDVFIHSVLDRSGSMYSMWDDSIGGIETLIKEQVAEDGTTWVSLTVFDAPGFDAEPSIETLYDFWNGEDYPGIPADVTPRGSTPLLDAIYESIKRSEQALAERPWFDGKVVFVIQTDGHENASKHRLEEIRALIAEKEAEGWEFLFLGANIDAFAEGGNMGFKPTSTIQYDSASVNATYGTTSGLIRGMRSSSK